jgi:hypothetical protein
VNPALPIRPAALARPSMTLTDAIAIVFRAARWLLREDGTMAP